MKTTNEQEKIFKSIKTGIKNARYGEINLNEIDIDLFDTFVQAICRLNFQNIKEQETILF